MPRSEAQKRYLKTDKGRAYVKRHNDIQYAKHRADRLTYAGAYVRIMRDERIPLLGIYKMMSGCVDCGYRGDPRALQFDHVRGVKLGTVSSMLTCSWKRIVAEIEKCEIRCANCHMIKTHPDAWTP